MTHIQSDKWFRNRCHCAEGENQKGGKNRPRSACVSVQRAVVAVANRLASKPQSTNKFQHTNPVAVAQVCSVFFLFIIASLSISTSAPCVWYAIFFCAKPIAHLSRDMNAYASARAPSQHTTQNTDRHSIFKSDCNSIGLSIRSLYGEYCLSPSCVRLARCLTHNSLIKLINK